MIRSFGDSATEDLYNGVASARARRFPTDILAGARRKLAMLNAAINLDVVAAVPGNVLEPLRGDRAGYYSIRINRQWRIVFRWDAGVCDVQVVDYHK